MFGWIARGLMVLAGFITSLFVSRDALNFDVIQMVVAVFIFTIFMAIIAFWPALRHLFKRKNKK